MLSLILAAALAATPAGDPPTVAPKADSAPSAQADAAQAVVAQAFAGPKSAEARAPSTSLEMLWLPGAALLALGAAAIVLTRRKKQLPSYIRVVETVSLGPKRSLLLAQLGEETLLLASSEAGVTLLLSRNAPVRQRSELAPSEFEDTEMAAFPRNGMDAGQAAGMAAAFESAMSDAEEDDELRAKLASGMRVMVR